MARSFLFSLWITLSLFAQAQDVHRQIRGQIIDEDNNPLIGVAIMIEETSQAVMTDVEGNFQIKPRVESGILLIRYLGIEPQQIDFALDEGEILDLGSIQVVFESISFTCCCCILVERYL
ncbi:MAG: carboxypeptidase-like regulatory domain-containing protein, partial [Bacteroidota bacterium]